MQLHSGTNAVCARVCDSTVFKVYAQTHTRSRAEGRTTRKTGPSRTHTQFTRSGHRDGGWLTELEGSPK